MNQEEIKTQIDEAKRVAVKIDSLIAQLEAQLAEVEKPELKNWEIGVNDFQQWIKINGAFFWIHDRDNLDEKSSLHESDFIDGPHINIYDVLDDLKARQEPLTEFKLSETFISGSLSGSLIYLKDRDEQSSLPLAKVRELVVYLQRLIFAAEKGGSHE